MPLPPAQPEPTRPRAQIESDDTIELMDTFPELFPGSRYVAAQEAAEEYAAELDYLAEQAISRSYGDCGVSKHCGLDDPPDWGERSPLAWF